MQNATFGTAPGAASHPETLSLVCDQFDSQIERAAELYERVRKIGDHIRGSSPREVAGSTGSAQPEPTAIIPRLGGKRDRLGAVLTAIDAELRRVENSF